VEQEPRRDNDVIIKNYGGSTNNLIIANERQGKDILFGVANPGAQEAMRITSVGRVGIGIVPSPTVPQIKLQVNGGNVQSITGNFTTAGPAVGDRWSSMGDRIPFATTAGFSSTGLRTQWDQYGTNFGLVDRASSTVRDGLISWQDGTTNVGPDSLNSTNARLRFVFRNNDLPSQPNNALEAMTIFANGKVGINVGPSNIAAIDNPATANTKLFVAGNILCEEVKVELRGNWPDFVFAKDYPLLSLEQKADYIEKNSHLPNVPSAQEVATNGVELGKMDATLLRQIEELTLHMIELKKQNDLLKKQVDALSEKVSNK
jgi:hypothetical protein